MSKPLPIEIPSDDCAVKIDGETYFPHEGESVWVVRGTSVAAVAAINRMMSMQSAIEAAKGEPDEAARVAALTDEAMQGLCAIVAPRIVRWTWTDYAGRPMPQPDGTAAPLAALETEELAWIVKAIQGETPAERKNGSRPSPTTSSASARRRTRR